MSYLGGSIAYLWGLVQTWTGRANNAWGASRVWNSGTSFESAYNSEVTLYNNEVAAYNTSQANLATMTTNYNNEVTAYNNEVAAYNSVLPPASADTLHTTFSSSVAGNLASITVDRTGYWVAMVNGNSTSGGSPTVKFVYNGASGVGGVISSSGSSQWGWSSGYDGPQLLSSGQTIVFNASGSLGGGINGDMWAVFVPTQSYPH